MEYQFSSKALPCLRTVINEPKVQELTQEIKLGEGEADVGRILCTYGQVMIRGKEWKSDSIEVSGGVTAWVLYMPENGEMPGTVEAWLPFTERWSLPPTDKDGYISVTAALENAEARLTGAGKMTVKAKIAIRAKAMTEQSVSVPVAENLPPDVELLHRTYSILLPYAYGEKAFTVEEKAELSGPAPEKIYGYTLEPGAVDYRIMGGRLLMRGAVMLHILYLTVEGVIHSADVPMRFSQMAEVNADSEDSLPSAGLCLSSVELDTDTMELKAGLICQYILSRRETVSLPVDGYSTAEEFAPITGQLELPALLDSQTLRTTVKSTEQADAQSVADITFWAGLPRVKQSDDRAVVKFGGRYNCLYYDGEGTLQALTKKWEQEEELPVARGVDTDVGRVITDNATAALRDTDAEISCDIGAVAAFSQTETMEILQGFRLEPAAPAKKPGIVICRAGERSLWQIAKEFRTTVSAIREANGIEGEPAPDKMLIIPS